MGCRIILYFAVFVFFTASAVATSIVSFHFDTSSGSDSSITASEVASSESVLFQVTTDKPTSCKYSTSKGTPYGAMTGNFDFNFETIHKLTLTELVEDVYKYYVRCKDDLSVESPEMEAIFGVNLPVSAQIILTDGTPVKAGNVEVKVITSKILSQPPSLSFSLDGISYNPVPLIGSGTTWSGFLVISESNEEEVGSFNFQGKDLEGKIGTEITSGGIFLVDTIRPNTITDIKAESFEGRIELSWYTEDFEDVENFNIYRSTSKNLDHADFYATAKDSEFVDTSVENGKTYYYKVSSIDAADNEGGLSPEVYATALLEDVELVESGLEARFFGVVDNFISEIDFLIDNAKSVKSNFESKGGSERELYDDLRLGREIDSAESELVSLQREIVNYKQQSLSEDELNKKLNAGKLKMNTIKKKIPDNIIVISEKSRVGDVSENDLMVLLLELAPDISDSTAKKTQDKSFDSVEESEFKVERKGYNLEIVYLDGSTEDFSLIKAIISSTLGSDDNISIVEFIPDFFAESVSSVEVKNTNYEVLNDKPIISFVSDTEEIVYMREGHADLNKIDEIKTILLHEHIETEKAPIFTGYFAFVNFSEAKNYFGVVVGVLIVSSLTGYFYFVRRKREGTELLMPARAQIDKAERKLSEGDLGGAQEIYESLSKEYRIYKKREKMEMYGDLASLHNKIRRFSG